MIDPRYFGTLALYIATYLVASAPAAAAEDSASSWWLTPHRLLQTNLREIDATMDVDRYVREVQAFGANIVLFNVEGSSPTTPPRSSTESTQRYNNTEPSNKNTIPGISA